MDSNSGKWQNLDSTMSRDPLNPNGKGRLPASGLTVCGNRVYVGAEDLCFPGFWSVLLDVTGLIFSAVAVEYFYGLDRRVQKNPDGENLQDYCEKDAIYWFETLLLIIVALWAFILLFDLAIFYFSLTSEWFAPPWKMHLALHTRIIFTLLLVGAAILTTTSHEFIIKHKCMSWLETTKMYAFADISLVLTYIGMFCAIAFAIANFCSSRDGALGIFNWRRNLRCLFCCGVDDSGIGDDVGTGTVLGSIAQLFEEFTRTEDHVHIVPSDIAAGLLLVEATQRRRAEKGELFLKPADGVFDCIEGRVTLKEEIDSKTQNNNKEQLYSYIADAQKGEQPTLTDNDWQRLAEAKKYAKYAFGAYGWMLQTLVKPSHVLCCNVCSGGPLLVGSGINNSNPSCCNWSYHSFVQITGCDEGDVMDCNLESNLGKAVYFLSVEHETKTLILSIRGTLSVADALTDMQAINAPFGTHSKFSAVQTHEGILLNARNLMKRLIYGEFTSAEDAPKNGVLSTLLDRYPDYRLITVGHSLGAGTAALFGILFADIYPERKSHVIAYAQPNVIAAEAALDPHVQELITTIVYDYDVIPQASVRNLYLLREQMMSCFAGATSSKWRVYQRRYQRRLSLMFEEKDFEKLTVNQQLDAAIFADTTTGSGGAEGSGKELNDNDDAAANDDDDDNEMKKKSVKPVADIKDVKIDIDTHVHTPPEVFDRTKMAYIAGRIYHIKPLKQESSEECCASSPEKASIVYPVHAESFQEIICKTSMFLDHMPMNYLLQDIPIPEQFDLI